MDLTAIKPLAVVTGASSGIGHELAKEFARNDFDLLISSTGPGLADVAQELQGLGASVATVEADLARPDAPAALVERAVDAGGVPDVVVFAAGVVAFGGFDELDDDVLDDLVLVNLLAPVRLLRAVSPHLREGAAVVHLSAVLAESPMTGMAAYGATKAALTAFDTAAAKELRRRKVRLVDVRPPHTETGLVTRALAGRAPRLPEGLRPEQVADRVVKALRDDETVVASDDF